MWRVCTSVASLLLRAHNVVQLQSPGRPDLSGICDHGRARLMHLVRGQIHPSRRCMLLFTVAARAEIGPACALADILALAGNSHCTRMEFLNDGQFRGSGNKAQQLSVAATGERSDFAVTSRSVVLLTCCDSAPLHHQKGFSREVKLSQGRALLSHPSDS